VADHHAEIMMVAGRQGLGVRGWGAIPIVVALLLLPAGSVQPQSFVQNQLAFSRVRQASQEKDSIMGALVRGRGLHYPLRSIFLRAFKRERTVELWGRDSEKQAFVLVKSYPLSAFSGGLGPKRAEGDLQIPEGFYAIEGENSFNPESNFHLSMLVNYPNASDRILGRKGRLGGEICIHGNAVTIGCLPITDDGIKEVYWVAVQAASQGPVRLPVHIFPARLDGAGMASLEEEYRGKADGTGHPLVPFWKNLQAGYQAFEKRHQLPVINVSKNGRYQVSER
jgi:murein L,D-transpeptidase YafK